MFSSFFALVRLVIIFAIGVTVIGIVNSAQNHKPIHAPRIVNQVTP